MSPPIQWQQIRIINYLYLREWQRQLRAILLIEGAWGIIYGDIKKPLASNIEDNEESKKWTKLSNVALGWMFLTLEDFTRQSVVKFDDPIDVLEDLFTRYTPPLMTFNRFAEREKDTMPQFLLDQRPVNMIHQEEDDENEGARQQSICNSRVLLTPFRGLFQGKGGVSKEKSN